ncbi:hypothetical protein UlMin_028564 [Ulmus minor]
MFQRGRGGRSGNSSQPICQVYGKIGHTAAYCYFKFDNSYMGAPPEPSKNNHNIAFIALPKNLADPAWYADSGASSHVTNDAGHLNQKQPYNGKESLIVGNGQGNGSSAAPRET